MDRGISVLADLAVVEIDMEETVDLLSFAAETVWAKNCMRHIEARID